MECELMFGWSKPKPPIDAEAKLWIETKLSWLDAQFGHGFLTEREVILPTPHFFPDPFDQTESSIRKMLNRVCTYMNVDRRYVNLELYTDNSPLLLVDDNEHFLPPSNAGTFESRNGYCIISIERSQLLNPIELVGTMAHELAHYRLIGEQRVRGNEYDNELLTDLTVVLHGLGIFLGNCPRTWEREYGTWPGTSLRKPEYMTLPMFAYALAHIAWWRHERRPTWTKHMNGDLRACFKSSVRYLFETGDSSLSTGKNA